MLSAKSRRLYRRLLELGPIARADAKAKGVDDDTLAELLDYGLVRDLENRLCAVPPRTARGQVAIQANRRTRDVLQAAVEAETFLESCMRAADRLRPTDEQLAELILDRAEIRLLSGTLQRQARREVRSVHTARFPANYDNRTNVVGPTKADTAAGIRYRVIYSQAFMQHDGLRKEAEVGIARGEEARVHPIPPLKFKLVDSSMALIPMDDAAEVGALLIRSAPVCSLFGDYFEKLWVESEPLTPLATRGSALKPVEMRILERLADDESDAAIARRLRISERSVRRHVSRFQQVLGVETRAGALAVAVRNGWLTI